MKHNWEYKILTDCIEKVKYTNKIQSSDYKKEGLYPIISQEDEYISGYCDNESDLFKISKPIVIFGDHTRIVKYIDFDFVLGADGVKILQPIDNLSAKFFSYFLKSYPIPSLGYSRHFKVIKEIPVPLPPLSTQQSIISELDSLSKIIADCKETLKDYDALEQSIFYDMFGDPVKNEKGWEVREMGSICEVTSFKRVLIEDVVDEGIPFVRGTELTEMCGLTRGEQMKFSLFITQEHYERVKKITGVPSVGDLLIPSINSKGYVWIVDTTEPMYYKDGRVLWVHINKDFFRSEYLQKTINSILLNSYSLMASGATFAELKLFILRELNIPVPPIELQIQFADKINAIEQMKVETKKALQEAETLFQARMDYWFN